MKLYHVLKTVTCVFLMMTEVTDDVIASTTILQNMRTVRYFVKGYKRRFGYRLWG